MNEVCITITYKEFADSGKIKKEEQKLLKEAREIAKSAYAPYSKFNVGASVLLNDGTIVNGNNQENAVYPSGLCAERVAVFSANALYPGKTIKSIAISAFSHDKIIDKPVSPCGSCRQSFIEYENKQNSPIKLILSGQEGKVIIINSAAELMPLQFEKMV